MWWTVGVIAAVSILTVGILAVPVIIGAIVAAAVYAMKGRKRVATGIATGILVGIGLTVLVGAVTCFAVLTVVGL